MAQQHNELRRGPLSRAFKELLGDTRNEGGIERFGETLTPGVDMWSQPEFAFLRGENLACGTNIAVAAAGLTSGARILNPTNSGFLIVVEGAIWYSDVSSGLLFTVGFGNTSLASGSLSVKAFRDLRNPNQNATVAILSQASDSSAGGGVQFARSTSIGAGTTVLGTKGWPYPIILAPGSFHDLALTTANIQLNWTFLWRERRAMKSELR